MAFDTIQRGVTSGNGAEVNADNEALVALTLTSDDAGYVKLADKNGYAIQFSDHGRVKAGLETMLFHDPVDGTVFNTNLWATDNVTHTIDINTQFIRLNAGASVATNTRSRITTLRTMPFIAHYPLQFHCKAKINVLPQSNATVELGLFNATAAAAPTDGTFFRWASDGIFRCVLANASVETTAVVTAPTINAGHHFIIYYTHGEVAYEIDGVRVAEMAFPAAAGSLTASTRLPMSARVLNLSSSPATAPQLYISEPNVAQMDLNMSKLWHFQQAGIGRGSYQSPVTTFLQTANHANSTSPTSATLSNTTAGYTTLGGRYQFAAVASAATDFALFGYQVPANYQLVIKGLRISAVLTGAAIATTATILDWSIAVGSSAVSLATAEAAGTAWAPRRIPVGMQGFPLAAPRGPCQIGDIAPDILVDFEVPIVCDGGKFVHVILQIPVGSATASQIFRGDVFFSGYFE